MTRPAWLAAGLLATVLGCASQGAVARGAGVAPQDWHDVKCQRYRRAWTSALARTGTAGLGPEFLARHAAFLASNCAAGADVCPHTPEEFALANRMVILSMNFGAASTFVPFACH